MNSSKTTAYQSKIRGDSTEIDPIDMNIHPTVTRHGEIRILELEGAGKGVDVFVEILIDRFLERVKTGLGLVVPDPFGRRDGG